MKSVHSETPAEDGQRPLAELEEKFTYQQRQLEELNAVVIAQQSELDRLRREVSRLAALLEESLAGGVADLPHEKPPHY